MQTMVEEQVVRRDSKMMEGAMRDAGTWYRILGQEIDQSGNPHQVDILLAPYSKSAFPVHACIRTLKLGSIGVVT